MQKAPGTIGRMAMAVLLLAALPLVSDWGASGWRVSGWMVSAWRVTAGNAPASAPASVSGVAQAQERLPDIEGDYDLKELKRLIEIARESGFSEKQIQDITVEDENGNSVKAWQFIQEQERRKKEEEARLAAERAKVYLTPQDVFEELDGKQSKDIDNLREKLLFVE